MSTYSTTFAHYYDSLMGHDTTISKTVKELLIAYAPRNKKISLLELGCGTGNVLLEMPQEYQLFGLDIAESMLTIARKKLHQATFFQGDMSDFQLKQTFNVIICVFDSINHLTTWKDWKSMFRCVYKHLSDKGIFIFDMNTMRRMALLATYKPYVAKIDQNNAIFVKIQEQKKNLYSGQFVILENIGSDKPVAIEQLVDEAVFPISVVKEELEKYFTIKKIVDPLREQADENSGRLFFVCKRK